MTLADRSGRSLTRAQAERMAADCIMRQGDAREFVEEAVRGMSDAEVMEWCVYPDTGLFPDGPYDWIVRTTPEVIA